MFDQLERLEGLEVGDGALAVLALASALLVGYVAKRAFARGARSVGFDDFARGTTFDRVASSFGTDTVEVLASTLALLIYASGLLLALEILGVTLVDQGVLTTVTTFLPNVVAAALILFFGVLVADRLAIKVREWLSDVRVSDVQAVPVVVRYSVIFVAVLMALTQLRISTTALHILLLAYVLGLVLFGALAARHVLSSATGGLYILITHPYGIGDRVRIGEVEGIVQEIDLLTTRIENEEREHVVPNDRLFEHGVSRKVE